MGSVKEDTGPGEDGLAGHTCARCQKPAKLQCPKCLELKLEEEFSTFCSQECFKVRNDIALKASLDVC
jgi:hypothetical protein